MSANTETVDTAPAPPGTAAAAAKPTTARERSRMDTRQRLMDAWRELFVTHPQQNATISDIARKAEVAVGTFYCHFKDKESLTREVALDSYAKLVHELDRLEMGKTAAPAEWVRATVDAVVGFVERHPREFMFLSRLAPGTTEEGREFIAHWERFWLDQTEAMLRAELEAGRVTLAIDPALTARALMGMVTGLLEWWVQDQSRASREALAGTLAALLLSLYREDLRSAP